MAVLRKKDMEFYYKSDFALVVSLSDVLTNEVRVYTTDRKRYIVAEAEVIDEDTTRLWVRGNAESLFFAREGCFWVDGASCQCVTN